MEDEKLYKNSNSFYMNDNRVWSSCPAKTKGLVKRFSFAVKSQTYDGRGQWVKIKNISPDLDSVRVICSYSFVLAKGKCIFVRM